MVLYFFLTLNIWDVARECKNSDNVNTLLTFFVRKYHKTNRHWKCWNEIFPNRIFHPSKLSSDVQGVLCNLGAT